MYASPEPSGQAFTPPVRDSSVAPASDMRSTLSRLGLGKKHSVTQATSLEAEVENYLAAPVAFHEDIIQFWQVCDSVL